MTHCIVSGGTTTTSSGSGSSSAGGPDPTLRSGDLNFDGSLTQADIERLKQALAGRIPIDKTTMDANRDGVVNSRDLIDLIRAVRAQERQNLQPASILPKR